MLMNSPSTGFEPKTFAQRQELAALPAP